MTCILGHGIPDSYIFCVLFHTKEIDRVHLVKLIGLNAATVVLLKLEVTLSAEK
jgi:hypothetical protein